jgi:hypothetical protein
MKSSILILLIFFQINAFPQSFWSKVVDDQNFNKSSLTCSSLFRDSLILLGGYVGNASCPGSELFAYDLKGERAWQKNGYFDVIYSDSNSIYNAGYIWGDDVAGLEQVVLTKFDKDGKEIFQTSYPDVPHNYHYEFVPNSIDINDNGEIIVSSKNSIIRADSLGKVVSETRLKLKTDISSVQFISASSFLVSTNSALYKSDSHFSTVDSVSFDKNIVSVILKNDTIYCLFPDKLVTMNTDFNVLNTLSASSDIVFDKIKFFGGDLWIQGAQADEAKILHLCKLKITETLTFKSLIPSPDFLVSENQVIFTGTSGSAQIGICSFNKRVNPDEIKLPDVEIVNFNMENFEIDYSGTFPRGYFFDSEMIIKNNGEDTITSFAIYSYLHGGMNCAHNYFYQKFSEILILPKQEISIQLNRIYEEGLQNNTICFEVLAPNSRIETITANNRRCLIFDVVKNMENSPHIQVFPNPTKDILNLKMEENGIKHVRLNSLNGSMVLENQTSACETNLDLTKFNSGIYLLSITSESGRFTQKIVKE